VRLLQKIFRIFATPSFISIIALALPLFTSSVFAANCDEEIRLDQNHGVFENIPVYTQNIGICYAVAASELVDAYRRQTGIDAGLSQPFISSPLQAAVQANRKTGGLERERITGGQICPVVDSINQNGSCEISVMEDLIQPNYARAVIQPLADQFTRDSKTNPSRLNLDMKNLTDASQNWDALLELFNVRSDGELRALLASVSGRKTLSSFVSNSIARKDGKPLNKNVNPATLEIILAHHNETDNAYKHILSALCQDRTRKPVSAQTPAPTCVEQNGTDFNKIGSLLSKGIPSEVKICVSFLEAGETAPANIDQCDAHSIHEIVVIGQRKNPKTQYCEYLIRNSWGPTCYGMNERFKCEASLGEVWVDEQSLARNAFAQAWLE